MYAMKIILNSRYYFIGNNFNLVILLTDQILINDNFHPTVMLVEAIK